jgi:hypothetical protein
MPGFTGCGKMPEIGVKSPKNVPPWLKPHSIYWLYTGVKTPVSLRIEFFRSLFSPCGMLFGIFDAHFPLSAASRTHQAISIN